jgi:cbb3-type cytochrome oxidase maturation protein
MIIDISVHLHALLYALYFIFVFRKKDIKNPSVNVIFILIAVSLLVAIGFLISFIWSIRAGQYEDEYTPSVRILFDDEVNVIEEGEKKTEVRSQKSEDSK